MVTCVRRRSPGTLKLMNREKRDLWRELVRGAEETYLPYARRLLIHLGPDTETEAKALIGTALVIQAHLQSLLWETQPSAPVEDAWDDPMDYRHVFHQILRQLAREGRRTHPDVSGVPVNAPANTSSTAGGVRRSFDLVRNLRRSAAGKLRSDSLGKYAEVLADFCEDTPFEGLNDLDEYSGRTAYMCVRLPAITREPLPKGKEALLFLRLKKKLQNDGSLPPNPAKQRNLP